MATWTTHGRHYHRYDDCFLKRSLEPSEYQRDFRGQVHIPFDNAMKLENEAATLKFVRETTEIPVPRVLEAREHSNGSYDLVTELVPGVPLEDITHAHQHRVIEQVKKHLKALRSLRSSRIGGPTGIVCPPPVAKPNNYNAMKRGSEGFLPPKSMCSATMIFRNPTSSSTRILLKLMVSSIVRRGRDCLPQEASVISVLNAPSFPLEEGFHD